MKEYECIKELISIGGCDATQEKKWTRVTGLAQRLNYYTTCWIQYRFTRTKLNSRLLSVASLVSYFIADSEFQDFTQRNFFFCIPWNYAYWCEKQHFIAARINTLFAKLQSLIVNSSVSISYVKIWSEHELSRHSTQWIY